jgi:hypothetical protein
MKWSSKKKPMTWRAQKKQVESMASVRSKQLNLLAQTVAKDLQRGRQEPPSAADAA